MRVLVLAAALTLAACGQTGAPQTDTSQTATASTTSTPAVGGPTPQADPASSHFWDHNLLQLMPQIDACIAKSPATRTVTYAGAYQGAVLVRLQGGDDTGLDCRVSNGQAQIAPADSAVEFPDDGKAIFIRGPGENPGGDCYVAPEVHDASGALLGWMIDPEGC